MMSAVDGFIMTHIYMRFLFVPRPDQSLAVAAPRTTEQCATLYTLRDCETDFAAGIVFGLHGGFRK